MPIMLAAFGESAGAALADARWRQGTFLATADTSRSFTCGGAGGSCMKMSCAVRRYLVMKSCGSCGKVSMCSFTGRAVLLRDLCWCIGSCMRPCARCGFCTRAPTGPSWHTIKNAATHSPSHIPPRRHTRCSAEAGQDRTQRTGHGAGHITQATCQDA